MKLHFLSIREENVDQILSGRKQWEFRRNPGFGIAAGGALEIGDIIFLVGCEAGRKDGVIRCAVRVVDILRGGDFYAYFEGDAGRLDETGKTFADKAARDAYVEHLRNAYTVAIRLQPYPVNPPISTDRIRRRTTGATWPGIGFVPAASLKRYTLDGGDVEEALRTYFLPSAAEKTSVDNG